MPIGWPAPIVDGTNATKLTHEDSVPISPSDELRVVLAVKRASGIPVVKNLCKLLLPALPRNYVQQTGVVLNTDTSHSKDKTIRVPTSYRSPRVAHVAGIAAEARRKSTLPRLPLCSGETVHRGRQRGQEPKLLQGARTKEGLHMSHIDGLPM